MITFKDVFSNSPQISTAISVPTKSRYEQVGTDVYVCMRAHTQWKNSVFISPLIHFVGSHSTHLARNTDFSGLFVSRCIFVPNEWKKGKKP